MGRTFVGIALALSFTSSALVGCGEDAALPAATAPIEILYGAPEATMLTPFPSDRYTSSDATTRTGLRLELGAGTTADPFLQGFPTLGDALGRTDGASTVGGAWVMFSRAVDVSAFARDTTQEEPLTPARDGDEFASADSPLLLVDVDPSSPERGQARGLVATYWEQPADGFYPTDDFTLLAEPTVPLRPATRYLFAVQRGLVGRDGAPVVPSAAMASLLNEPPKEPYAEEVHEGLVELSASLGVGAESLAAVTVFTTRSVIDDVEARASEARASAPPALLEDFTVETPSTAADPRVRFRAVFEAPELRGADGKWSVTGGVPVVQKKVGLELYLAFSDGTKSGPRPVVFFAHGLGGTKDGCWGTAERLAELGVAVIAIDSPEHGSRAEDPEDGLAATFGFFGIDADSGDFDIERARDNFRQMASDQLELVRLVGSLGALDVLPVGAPDGVPDLDVSRFAYIGHSFGSVQGPTVFALAPEIRQAVWNVGGAGLMRLLRDSATFGLLVDSMKPAGTTDGALARFFALTQGIVDPGDPLNYARFGAQEAFPGVPGWAPRDMLLQEVVEDTIVPNSTSEALARAAGLVHLDVIHPIAALPEATSPWSGGGPGGSTAALVQFDEMDGGELAVHGSLIFSEVARKQYVQFFASGLASEHATVDPVSP